MKFELENVFTCLNAESLKVGSKVVFADDLDTLKQVVEDYDDSILYSQHNEDKLSNGLCYVIDKLAKIEKVTSSHRFVKHNEDGLDTAWILAYLLEEPKELEYKPFNSDTDLLLKKIKYKNSTIGSLHTIIVNQYPKGVSIIRNNKIEFISYNILLKKFVFIDGTPCGILNE